MARFNPHHDNSKLYPAMREFAAECLLRNGSLLQPGLGVQSRHLVDRVKHLNNMVEQDHRIVMKRLRPMLGFKPFLSPSATL